MARMTKAEKAFNKAFEEAFYRLCFGVQFNIFDLGKVKRSVEAAVKAGTDMDTAVKAAAATYRVN